MYTYIPSFSGLPPIPAPLGHHWAPRWDCSFKFNDCFWWSYSLAISSFGSYQSIFRLPDTFCVTVSLYMLFPLPAVLTLHLISCSFWSFYVWQIFTHFWALAQNFLWNFSCSLKAEPICTNAPKLTFPVALHTSQVWLIWHSFVITLNLNISP